MGAGVVLLLWVGLGVHLVSDLREASKLDTQRRDVLARAFAEHARRTMLMADHVLRDMRSRYRDGGRGFDLAMHLQREVRDPVFRLATIVGPDGLVVASSRPFDPAVNLSDREHFRVHAEAPEVDSLFISKPVVGRVSGESTLQFTRPLTSQGRGFGGVMVLSVATDYFSDFFRDVSASAGVAAFLVGRDGTVRAWHASGISSDVVRTSILGTPLYDAALSGTHRGVKSSSLDGRARIYTAHVIPEFRMAVLIGSSDPAVAYWRSNHPYLLCGLAIAASLMALALSRLAFRLADEYADSADRHAKALAVMSEAVEMKSRFIRSAERGLRPQIERIATLSKRFSDAAVQRAELVDEAAELHARAQAAQNLVDGLHDVAAIVEPHRSRSQERVNVAQLVLDIADQRRADAEAKGVSLSVSIGPEVPLAIIAERILLAQVLHRLIDLVSECHGVRGMELKLSMSDDGDLVVSISPLPGEGKVPAPASLSGMRSAEEPLPMPLGLIRELVGSVGGAVVHSLGPGGCQSLEVSLPVGTGEG